MADSRELALSERGVLVRVLSSASLPGAEELLDQVPVTTVLGGLPTLLDLAVARSARPASVPDGPVPMRAFVIGDSDEIEGEILVWVQDGYLSGLEFAWLTEEAPANFPAPERIRTEA